MSVAFIQAAQGSVTSQALTGTVSGNLIVQFVNQNASGGVAGVPSQSGWTFNSTQSFYNTSSQSTVSVGYQYSSGGTVTANPTAGTNGTVLGITVYEISGASTTIDTIVGQTLVAVNTTTRTSASITTSNAGSIILAAVGLGNGNGGSAATPWTASNSGTVGNVGTAAVKSQGGYYIPGATVSGITLTANWITSRPNAMLVAAFKPSGAASAKGNFLMFM